ncbi:MAG: FkbM family methyltransferase [Thermodesulfovibrionales bacterium]
MQIMSRIREYIGNSVLVPFYARYVRRLAALHSLYGLLWRVYCRMFGPSNGILRINAGGQTVNFYVHTQAFKEKLMSFDGEIQLLNDFMEILKPGDTVWDIGAEIGLYTLFLSQVVGEQGNIIAFEPENSSYAKLMANLRLNNINNVHVLRQALGDCTGESRLFVGRMGAAPGLTALTKENSPYHSMQKVEVIDGDTIREIMSLPIPDAVKIDVEGYEYNVIRGLKKTLGDAICRTVCCEIHPLMLPDGITDIDVINLLKSCGFNKLETFSRNETYHVFCSKK